MTNDTKGRVLISGASVAGLTTAYWLDRYGFAVEVVERSAGPRPGGQALDVRGPALQVARRMGIADQLRDRRTNLLGMSVVDGDGTELFQTADRTLTGGQHDSPDVEILRDDLIDVLRQAVGDRVSFRFNDRVVGLQQDADGVAIEFGGGATDRFDVVVGADGTHSGVRRLVFGPEAPFLRYLGGYVGVMTVPNFIGLDRWQTFHVDGDVGAGMIGLAKDQDARAYIGIQSETPLDYDYRDVTSQKQLLADHAAGLGWVVPELITHMWRAESFHFDSRSQVIMEHWVRGRVALVGDAGYAVSLTSGQGTSVAMTGAYVLAGELAAHADDLAAGAASYEDELRDYVLRNQRVAQSINVDIDGAASGELVDFGAAVEELALKSYD